MICYELRCCTVFKYIFCDYDILKKHHYDKLKRLPGIAKGIMLYTTEISILDITGLSHIYI